MCILAQRLFAEQWHSGGVAGRIWNNLIDPYIRGIGVVVSGVFRPGDPPDIKGSSNTSAVTDWHWSLLSTNVLLFVDAVIYTVQVHYKCVRFYITLCMTRRRQWDPTPVLLPGKSHGRRSLEGCSPWGRWGSDTTKQLHFHFSLSCIGEGNGNPLQCLALRIPGTGEPGGLLSMGLHRIGHDWSDLAAAAACMATHPSILAWRIPMEIGAWWATVCVGYNWVTKHSMCFVS